MEWNMESATDGIVVIAVIAAVVSLIVSFGALIRASATRRKVLKTEETVNSIETGRTKALASAEQLLSAMHRLAVGYRTLASTLRESGTVVPDSVQEITKARQDVEQERAVAHLYWPEGVSPHVEEVTAITEGVDADPKVLDDKAVKIEQHKTETARLFKTRYLNPAA